MQTFRYESRSEKAYFNKAECVTGSLDDARDQLCQRINTLYRNIRHAIAPSALRMFTPRKTESSSTARSFYSCIMQTMLCGDSLTTKSANSESRWLATYEIVSFATQIMAPEFKATARKKPPSGAAYRTG